ncbi:MAG: nucleotidyltransferase domain-containing protein [Schwartzia sp.]|nr:nucleotidyltransferase domain-containing protein [Schwartzia sp. (in: firmicutes)]
MNSKPFLDAICKRIVEAYRKAYGNAVEGIFLYGSYARGDYDEESDIDFVAIVNGDRLDLQKKCHQVWDEINKMDLEYDTVTSAQVIPAHEYEKYKGFLSYYKNIQKEGKRIG